MVIKYIIGYCIMSYLSFLIFIIYFMKSKDSSNEYKKNAILPLSVGLAFAPIIIPIALIIFIKNNLINFIKNVKN